jgi:hypothetical protein
VVVLSTVRPLCARLPPILTHGIAPHLDAVRGVDQPVENAIGKPARLRADGDVLENYCGPEIWFGEAWPTAVHVGAPDLLEARFWITSGWPTMGELPRKL